MSLPPDVTDSMIEDQVAGPEWEALMDELLASGLTPDEIRARINQYPTVERLLRTAWDDWDDLNSERDYVVAGSWPDQAALLFGIYDNDDEDQP